MLKEDLEIHSEMLRDYLFVHPLGMIKVYSIIRTKRGGKKKWVEMLLITY